MDSAWARFFVHEMYGLRRIGHLDPLFFEAPLDFEIDLLDTVQIFRVVEVLAPVGNIEMRTVRQSGSACLAWSK